MSPSARSTVLLLLATWISYVLAECESYGMDFQDTGSYFINSLDTSPFTVVSQFDGCVDIANVILIAPNDDSWLCTDVSMTPDDTNQLSTCPITKAEMYTGLWRVVLLSNNGDGREPFTAERKINLVVDVQQTTTFVPTVTVESVSTPSVTTTLVVTDIDTVTKDPVTITAPSQTAKRTVTIRPPRVTKWVTSTYIRTVTTRSYTNSIVYSTKTATCSLPKKPKTPDPVADPLFLSLAQEATAAAALSPRRNTVKRDSKLSLEEVQRLRVLARRLQRRAPDSATITVTDTDTAHWSTITTTATAPTATTITEVSISEITSTVTPAPVTVFSGIATATVTAPTSTRTRTTVTKTTKTVTQTSTLKVTVTTTITPTQVTATCSAHGGVVVT
ncbi:hypothetical protein PVAG01_07503 [Phlyctema vagabunda]|uniref:Uncharacterized protein n=1 Tax=Phlyctema vagabunda TaxID=108571 RepID=A0ABR4PCM9_9HELO